MTEPTPGRKARKERASGVPSDFHPEDTRPPGAKESDEFETTHSAASKLFDLRILIGGLFTVYGLMLTIAGFFTSSAELQKASGININLWLGIGMLILGLLFLLWVRLSPLKPSTEAERAAAGPARPGMH